MSVARTRIFHTIHKKFAVTFINTHIPPSPVPHLLSANATPTEEDRKLIREAIADAETQMSLLEQATEGVNDKRLELFEDFLQAHRALLIPIRNLPPELLQEIFLFYSETTTGYHRWIRPPFVLGQVCKAWRQAAVALPGLWNKLPAFKLGSSKTRKRPYNMFLEELLRRSGNSQTLRVFIRAPFKEINNHPIIATLTPHAKRIQTLTIESGLATIKLFAGMANDLTNLEQLDLAFWTYKTIGANDQLGRIDEFQSAPKLKRVSIMGKCPPTVTLPWSTLEEYKERYDGGPALQVFEHSRASLTTLELVKVRHQLPMIPPTTLDNLKTLTVKLEHPSDVAGRFLTHMTLPDVESVQVYYGGTVAPLLTTMLSHSSHTRSLRSLAFRGTTPHSFSELKNLFSVVPQLRELDMEVTDGDYGFLSLFTDPVVRPLTLPLLEKLSINTVSTHGMEDIINSIARVRCERAESDTMPSLLVDPTHLDFDLIQELRPLETLRVNLVSRESRLESQAALNGWKAPTRFKQYRDTAKLQMWRKEIMRSFSSYFADPEPGLCLEDPRMMKDLKRGKIPCFPENWEGILGEIEQFDSSSLDTISLRAANLHHTLSDITLAPIRYTMNRRNHHCIQRARKILDDWRTIVMDVLPEYRWVLIGSSSLVYLPVDSPIRLSEDKVEKIVYGVRDDMTHDEVFWPQQL